MAPSPDPNSVWRLKPGHPDFTGPVADDVNDLDRLDAFDGTPIGAWEPMPAHWDTTDPGRPIPDVTSMVVPALAERGLEVLGELIDGHAQTLPLQIDEGPAAWLLNVTTLSDALDEEASEIKRFRDGRFMKPVTYVFDPGRLEGLTIFKLRQQPMSTVLVTGAVVRRIRDAGLTGGDLTQVWTP